MHNNSLRSLLGRLAKSQGLRSAQLTTQQYAQQRFLINMGAYRMIDLHLRNVNSQVDFRLCCLLYCL